MDAERRSCLAGDWHDALKARFSDRIARKRRAFPFSITTFRDLPPDLHQPSLADDVLCLHRGGAKRVYRSMDGRRTVHDVPLHALTLMPRHQRADWRTEGPDDFVHVTLNPKAFDELLLSECGKPRSQIELGNEVGFTNPLLCGLATEMTRVADESLESRLYVDTLFTAFSLALLRHCSGESGAAALDRADGGVHSGGMAGWRLRQILDYMEANKAREIQLAELTAVSGLSRAHFFRTFRQATGVTPGRYLERLRVEDARRFLDRGDSLEEASSNAGFSSTAALSHAFRRVMTITPAQYRRWYR